MKDNNLINDVVLLHVKNLANTYNTVLRLYNERAVHPLGLVDCGIFALAIAELCKHKKIGIEEYLKDNAKHWHSHTYLFVLYSFIDISITLKLNNIPALAALTDVAYEVARNNNPTPDISFMKYYIDGALIADAIDTEKMKGEHKTEWFRLCLLALESFKKAQKIALLDNVNMPIREALLALQVQTIHFAMVEPEIKRGYTLAGINTIAYNHLIPKEVYRNIAESACSYLGNIYRKKKSTTILTTPYEFSPEAAIGL